MAASATAQMIHELTGILEYAYAEGRITDGVEFSVLAEGESGEPRLLFSRYVRPVENPGDRGRLGFKVSVDSRIHERILLVTGPGPGKNNDWDRSVWLGVIFR